MIKFRVGFAELAGRPLLVDPLHPLATEVRHDVMLAAAAIRERLNSTSSSVGE